MKKSISTRTLFVLGFLVIVTANIIVISHVAYNRTGAYETIVDLTQRELTLPYYNHEENSGISLQLQWRVQGINEYGYSYNHHYDSPDWMDADKLRSLGFSMNAAQAAANRHKRSVPKKAFIVLEYEGKQYQESLAGALQKFELAENAATSNPEDKKLREEFERAKKQLENEKTIASRLFAIDAGINPDILRKKYSDRSRFIIAPGIVEQTWNYENKKAIAKGYISRLCVESIHVPLEFRKSFGEILSKNKSKDKSCCYRIQIAYGSLFEPWIRSVDRITDVNQH